MKPTITPEQDVLIAKMYDEGKSAYQIARDLDLTHTIIYGSLDRTGIERRGKNEAYRKYHFDEHVFDEIDTPEKAYWIGFLYADGYINRTSLRLNINIEDKSHVEKFNSFLDSDYPILEEDRLCNLNNKMTYKALLIVTHHHFAERLLELGISSGREDFNMSEIPQHLYHYWILGYFDGDGCITRRKNIGYNEYFARVNFSANKKDVLEFIVRQFSSFGGIKNKKIQTRKGSFAIDYCGKNICRKIYDYMYEDTTVFLDRKKEKFMEFYPE